MLVEIFRLLLSAIAGLLGSALLLRMYLGWLRVSRNNPLAIFCVALTDWLVAPLRRVLPLRGRIDAATLAAALVVAVVFVFIMGVLRNPGPWNWYLFLPSVLLLLIHWALYLIMMLVLANVIFSLVNPAAPLAPVFDILSRPFLAPLRRVMPLVGGFDLSPTVLIFVIWVALLVLDQLMF
jgi:YggT family protein